MVFFNKIKNTATTYLKYQYKLLIHYIYIFIIFKKAIHDLYNFIMIKL